MITANNHRLHVGGYPPLSGEQTVVRFPEDFTYLGAFRVPNNTTVGGTSSGEGKYGKGLTFRRVAADTTEPRHLLSTGYSGAGTKFGVYEFRVATPIVGTGFTIGQYNESTVVKSYGRKPYIDSGATDHFSGDYLDGTNGIKWDEESGKLLWCYHNGYNGGTWVTQAAWGYASLDYDNNEAEAEGWDYSLDNQGTKAVGSGFFILPNALADTYFSGENIVGGFGGYFSIIATGDISMGASATLIPRSFIGSAPASTFSGTPLFGYWPHSSTPGSGKGRSNRPEVQEETDYSPTEPAWGVDKWDWNDRVRSGVVIYTTEYRGFLFFSEYGRTQTQYLSSQIPSLHWGYYSSVYDPHDSTPISSTARYDIQPSVIQNFQFPVIDHSELRYSGPTSYTDVTSVVSDSGERLNSYVGCLVTAPSHGLSGGVWVQVQGADISAYNGLWEVSRAITSRNDGGTPGAGSTMFTAVAGVFSSGMVGLALHVVSGTNFVAGTYLITGFTDANTVTLASSPSPAGAGSSGVFSVDGVLDDDNLYIRNSAESVFWPGGTSSNEGIQIAQISSGPEQVIGADFDPVDEILYIAVSKQQGVNNLSGQVLVMMYQLNEAM